MKHRYSIDYDSLITEEAYNDHANNNNPLYGYLKVSGGTADHIMMRKKRAQTIEEYQTTRIKRLEKAFSHYHVNAHNDSDACKQCGLDLRDPIHLRREP